MKLQKSKGASDIRKAQKKNEKIMLDLIRKSNKRGLGYRPTYLGSLRLFNALGRLVKAGKVKYKKRMFTSCTGYFVV